MADRDTDRGETEWQSELASFFFFFFKKEAAVAQEVELSSLIWRLVVQYPGTGTQIMNWTLLMASIDEQMAPCMIAGDSLNPISQRYVHTQPHNDN